MRVKSTIVFLLSMLLLRQSAWAQQQEPRGRERGPELPPTLGLEQGLVEIDTPDFTLELVKASQTVAALQSKGAKGFDFTPADRLQARAGDGFYHLGDITFRARKSGSDSWTSYSTAAARKPVQALALSPPVLAAADLTGTLPEDCPLQITRSWLLVNEKLVLRFEVENRTAESVQVGALGIPLIFNNIITRRSLPQAHEICSFSDPYIGLDAGYLQVTRLSGQGPALLVVPDGRTPFEAYRRLDEPMRPNQTFEGMFEWMVYSQAYAENEWRGVKQWNPPTSLSFGPGETRTFGIRFLVSDEIRNLERTLAGNRRPVAIGIPGYVLPADIDGRLFLNCPSQVKSVAVEPPGALEVKAERRTRGGWNAYRVRGLGWGRATLTLTYADGLRQSVHYYVTKPAAQVVTDMGNFLFTKQWFAHPNDPFKRSPSIMSYNRETDKIVTQDSRVWIAGLGDEGGSGSWLAAALKLFGQPVRPQLEKYEQFVGSVLWGGIQYKQGENTYGVRKSLFYYAPDELPAGYYDSSLNWGTWTSWNKRDSEKIDRAYNYPHVVAAYWSMYRLARNNDGLVTNHPWDWYLEQAYQTCMFLTSRGPNDRPRVGYLNTGLMEGDIFVLLLEDLKREGWKEKAADLESRMKLRADRWAKDDYPFGSEMAWDSTGQEEVYAWCKYFGYHEKALVSLNSILAYMPAIPHWGYNGNARRYWDFLYGGAPGPTSRIERQLHHYGSGLNAIPVLARFREQPDDLHLLRIGYAGMMGALSNIDQEGFASAAFHSFPSTLKWDAYSGDYGPSFFGHALNTATYVIQHPEFGWQVFGGNLKVRGNQILIQPLDSFRTRVYVAPFGLWLTLDSGKFESVQIRPAAKRVRLGFAAATPYTRRARLRIEQPTEVLGVGRFRPPEQPAEQRGAFEVQLGSGTTWIELRVATGVAGPK